MDRSDSDIVSSISSLFPEVPFTLDDIRRPDPGKMRNLYVNFVHLVLNEENKIVEVPNPADCFDDLTLQAVAIYKGIRYIFQQSQFSPPVYPGDILLPSAESVRRLLSAFINICAFQEMVDEQMQACKLELLKHKQHSDKMEQRLREIEKQLYEATIRTQEHKAEEEKTDLEIAEVSEQLMTMELKRSDHASQLLKEQNETAAAKEKLDKLTSILSNHEAEVHQLRGKVVEDPEGMKLEASKVKETEEEIASYIDASKQRVRELEGFITTVKLKTDQAEARLLCIQALEKVDSHTKKRNEELSGLVKTMKDCELAVSNLEADLKAENQTLSSLLATKQEQQAALDTLKETHTSKMNQYHRTRKELEEKLQANLTDADKCVAETEDTGSHVDRLKQDSEQALKQLQQQIERCYSEAREISERHKKWMKDLSENVVAKVLKDA